MGKRVSGTISRLGAVDILLLSANLRKSRLRSNARAAIIPREDRTYRRGKTVTDIAFGNCPKCTAPVILEEEIDIIDELTKLADQSSAKVETHLG